MSNTIPPPPPGFVMQSQPRRSPAPPPGFVMQEPDDTAIPGPSVPNLPPPSARQEPYSGAILPFSRDAEGNVSFDSNAGLLGVAKRAFTLPGQVFRGEVDPLSDEGIGRAAELASVASPVNPAVRAGSRVIPGVAQNLQREAPPAPTAEALKSAARSGYDDVRDSGVDYSAASVRDMAAGLRANLEGDGILAELAPKSFRVLERLENPPEGAVAPIAGLEAARRSFNNAARDFNNPTDQEAARRLVSGLDSFIEGADPSTVVAGSAADAAGALRAARGNYAAAKRSDTLTGLGEAAELRAAVANSGQNLDNATRQRLASLLLNRKASAGFSADERQAIEQVARGVPSANALRAVGNILGGGGGLGAMLTGAVGGGAGSMVGGVPGAVVGSLLLPGAGSAMKGAAARATQRGLSAVDEATRRRSPLYESLLADAPMIPAATGRQQALIRALLGSQAASAQ